ncbi:helix-turn-helix domain-containing protein [Streptomyces sp. NPDC013740]|uniref:helix-turn-helix domain-containing protein n=1 Tax=Streptomyces sp. NPDC013740 TaxID=3364867 RepID=UPI0036F601B2
MDTQKTSARPAAAGLVHVNVRHTTRYTVVGNHLAQHRELSLLAIGLSVHLQSLPAGAAVGVKAIAAKFPESELRVAAAMRELEAHGYLKRVRERLPNGKFVQYTVSYNRPGADPEPTRVTPSPPRPPQPPPPPNPPPPAPAPASPAPAPASAPPLAERDRPAAELLTRLRLHDPRLLLGERDIERLAPGVTAWLDRGAHPDAVSRTLSAALPNPLAHPAALLAHRLRSLLPPPLPPGPPPLPATRMTMTSPRSPFAECEDCGLPFRGAPPPDGLCLDCRPVESEAA